VRNDNNFTEWQTVPWHEHHFTCNRCAPPAPAIGWARHDKRKIIAVEDTAQAGAYERALKRRPAAFVTQMKADEDGTAHFRVGTNTTSLMHRALSRLPSKGRTANVMLSWRLNTDFTPAAKLDLPRFQLLSNKPDAQHAQPPHFAVPLRPEQLRSLTWMIGQESLDAPAFVEEEISEAVLEPLGWRVEGRAQREHRVRGGVLADEVGYGKTAITLGLIDCTKKDVRKEVEALEDEEMRGKIPTRATLIIVPGHLTRQWVSECEKFAPETFKVLEIPNMARMNNITVDDILGADIIIASSTLFKGGVYLGNLGAFAAVGGMPDEKAPNRYFSARLETNLDALKEQVELLKTKGPQVVLEKIEEVAKNGKLLVF
jgi:hypothetical protein